MARISIETLVENLKDFFHLDPEKEFKGELPMASPDLDVSKCQIGAVVDCETTDLNEAEYGKTEMTELGAVKFYYDKETFEFKGVIKVLNQMQEPTDPKKMTETIKEVTGLTFEDLKGKSFNKNEINDFFKDVKTVHAHNSKFDRKFVEPYIGSKKWGCSFADIDWANDTKKLSQGYFSERQEILALQNGFWYKAHRAEMDCLANIKLLLESGNFSSFMQDINSEKGHVRIHGFLDPRGESAIRLTLKDPKNKFGVLFKFASEGADKFWSSSIKLNKEHADKLIKEIEDMCEECYSGRHKLNFTFVIPE